MAVPVENGHTALGGQYEQAPVLGVVVRVRPGLAEGRVRYAVGAVGAATLLVRRVNGQMLGLSRLAYSLATNRQIPSARRPAAPAPRRRPTWSIAVAAVIAFGARRCRTTSSFLAGIFAFGAMLAFAIAHMSVIALRFREAGPRRARSGCRSRSGSRRHGAAAGGARAPCWRSAPGSA